MAHNETHFGFPVEDWERAKLQAKDHLTACARRRATTTYSELCSEVDAIHLRPYSFAIVAFLNEICTEEDAAHGVMMASLVVRKDTGIPGDGYFGHAGGLGRDISDREAFWRSEVERVWDVYGV
jgi:hypothetical protein